MSEQKPNRLAGERSPYLRQHAYNPVAWYPWGEEAFRDAARADKPVFLSIGYSTCHWCHVMERESFADEETAHLMNETFVSVKVDREERPDIDSYFMAVCQLMTGSGGWPLTVILTPDKRPFFAGTYFPGESRFGLVGLKDLIARVAAAWKQRRPELLRSSAEIIAAMADSAEARGGGRLSRDVLDLATSELIARFDGEFAGFGRAPKFPTPHHLTFLLRQARRKNDGAALDVVERTLQAMRRGGIFDQVGFGFHRYSTDRRWLLPHFEKMLYDQALLTMAYTEAFQLTHRDEYRRTADEILTYGNRDLKSPRGAFYTAEDADSEGEEGRFYVWELAEVEALLPSSDAKAAKEIFSLESEGNFTGPGGRPSGKNILHLGQPAGSAARLGISEDELQKTIARISRRLLEKREERPRPPLDNKILTDWNGLMIAALAKAAQAFGRADYAEGSAAAAEYLRNRMTIKGKLQHCSTRGEAAVPAFLDDYAFLIWGLIELYEAALDPGHLSWAAGLAEKVVNDFWDEKEGAFFFTSSGSGHDLPLRRKEAYDGALPSGNSVMVSNLLRLGRILGRPDLEARAGQLVSVFAEKVSQSPSSYTQFLCGLDLALNPPREVVIVGRRGSADTQLMLDVPQRGFFPDAVVLFRPSGEKEPEIAKLAPFTAEMKPLGDKATAYVCSNYRCGRPTTDPGELRSLLEKPPSTGLKKSG